MGNEREWGSGLGMEDGGRRVAGVSVTREVELP